MFDNLLTQFGYRLDGGTLAVARRPPAAGFGRYMNARLSGRSGPAAAHAPRRSLARALALACVAAMAAGAVHAQSADRNTTQLRLDELTEAIKVSQERAEQLRSEAGAIKADRAELNRRLIDTADRIKASEAQLDAAEERLVRLADQERILNGSLKTRRKELAEILAALQRLGRSPPPPLAVRPQAALEAIRSAILLGAVVPELRGEAQRLANDLESLVALRTRIAGERTQLAASTAALAEERVRIEALIESKRLNLAETLAEFEDARRQADKLGRETQSLQELIARMDAEVPAPEPQAIAPEARRATLTDPGRIRPAMAFADARGLLPLPVAGVPVARFGEADGFGGTLRGISIAARPGAQVTSPSDGWIVYSGPFRSYGQLLIMNVGGGYHVILAGLDRISVELGQFVLAGEPVGIMGRAASAGPTLVAGVSSDRPVLYVEFRKDGTSIDPGPWWASAEQKVRG